MTFLVVVALMVLVPAFAIAMHMDRHNEVRHRLPPAKPREVYRWKEVRRRYPERVLQRRRVTHA